MDVSILLFLFLISVRIHIIVFSVSFIIVIIYFFGMLFPLLLFTYWNHSTIKLFTSSMTIMTFSFSHFYFLLFYTFLGFILYHSSFLPWFCLLSYSCDLLWISLMVGWVLHVTKTLKTEILQLLPLFLCPCVPLPLLPSSVFSVGTEMMKSLNYFDLSFLTVLNLMNISLLSILQFS